MTGDQKKNYAAVRYPQVLDLGKWMLGSKSSASDSGNSKSIADLAITQASESMLLNRSDSNECLYRLKAVITHYGRHENGHYIAYRQHPPASQASDDTVEGDATSEPEESQPVEDGKFPWWRLSDEDVSAVPNDDVLQQGGVFMLFYEREEQQVNATVATPTSNIAEAHALAVEAPVSSTEPQLEEEESLTQVKSNGSIVPVESLEENTMPTAPREASASSTTEEEESETDTDDQPAKAERPIPRSTTQPLMRTAGVNSAQSDSGFPSPHRGIAAT
jgi:ubiquitin carboxyl-terminal hydrolase 1